MGKMIGISNKAADPVNDNGTPREQLFDLPTGDVLDILKQYYDQAMGGAMDALALTLANEFIETLAQPLPETHFDIKALGDGNVAGEAVSAVDPATWPG